MAHFLYREPTAEELALERLRRELVAARTELGAREHALAEFRGQLMSFEGRYIRQVGLLYKQLDEWEKKITELHASQRAVESFEDSDEDDEPERADDERVPIPDLKALFRELAKRIHPDFASDDMDEATRTRLMAQANEAYLRKDAEMLQRMLNGFDPALESTTVEEEMERVGAQIEAVRGDIAAVDAAMEEMRTSEIAMLQERVIEASKQGKDLLAEQAARVKGRIGLAMRQYELDLDRIKRPPQGAMVESLLSAATPTTKRYTPNPRRN